MSINYTIDMCVMVQVMTTMQINERLYPGTIRLTSCVASVLLEPWDSATFGAILKGRALVLSSCTLSLLRVYFVLQCTSFRYIFPAPAYAIMKLFHVVLVTFVI